MFQTSNHLPLKVTKFGVFVITGVIVKFSMFFTEKMSLFFRCGFCFHDFLLPVFKECLETFLFNMTKSFLLRKTAICVSLEYNGRNGKLSSGSVDSIILGTPGAAYWDGTWVVAKVALLAL